MKSPHLPQFYVDDSAFEKLYEFYKHNCTQTMVGAIDGKTTFSFTPTSIGTVVKVKCVCGNEADLTDYENW